MATFELQENNSLEIQEMLEKLGYYQPPTFRNSGDLNKAAELFRRRNEDRLRFLDLSVGKGKIHSKGKSGAVSLLPALGKVGEPFTLMVTPLFDLGLVAQFAGQTKFDDWLEVDTRWEIEEAVLDIKLWQLAWKFVSIAKKSLERPARSFERVERIESVPQGITDWQDFTVNRYPYGQMVFRNQVRTATIHNPVHSTIKWLTKEIKKSIQNRAAVPQDYLHRLQWIEKFLENVEPIVPYKRVLDSLPRSGAWTGYQELYSEMYRLAEFVGLIEGADKRSYATLMRTERLYELMVMDFAEEWGRLNGFRVYRDDDDTSRISINNGDDHSINMLHSLRPDVVLESDDTVMVIDAKYKKHYDYATGEKPIRNNKWKESYRHDIHQVLCYGVGYAREKSIYLLSHPTKVTSENVDKKPVVHWTIGGRSRWIGLLPLCHGEEFDLESIKHMYFEKLDRFAQLAKKGAL